jgi:ornithine decarboxylase
MAPSAIQTYDNDNSYNNFLTNNSVKDLAIGISNHGAGIVHSPTAQQLISQALKERGDGIDPEDCESGDEDAFFVADLGEVYRQHLRWKMHLGRVKPHYGMLCLLDF